MDVKEFLIRLCETPRVSGRESAAAALVAGAFVGLADDVYDDAFGNVVAVKKGRGKGKLMFSAHLDEVGMMVSHIGEDGFVSFTRVGGVDPRVLTAQEVTIHGREPVFGVIGFKPPHLNKPGEEKEAVKLTDLTIDTGYDAETIKTLVRAGDAVTVNPKTRELMNGRLSSTSLDNAAGVAALYAAAWRLARAGLDMDVYFVATVQEEVGLRGAGTAAYRIAPDIAVTVDVGYGKTPELTEADTLDANKGPALAVGTRVHPVVFETLKTTAAENGIAYQIEPLPGRTGTETDAIQVSRQGVATGLVSIPLKYMHAPVETVKLDDIRQTGRLLAEFALGLNGRDLNTFLGDTDIPC